MDEPSYREEYLLDAWSSFVRKNLSYMTHTLVDINELMSDIISIMHLSFNTPDANVQIKGSKSGNDGSPRRRMKAK